MACGPFVPDRGPRFYEVLTPYERRRCGSPRPMSMATRYWTPLRRSLAGMAVVASVAVALTIGNSDRPGKQARVGQSILAGANVPVQVRRVLQRACQNCHSDHTNWPRYAHIPPISRQIHSDVAKGKAFMDLSKWNEYTDGQRRRFMVAI